MAQFDRLSISILNDVESPLIKISRSRYYSTSNNLKRYKIEPMADQ